MGRRGPPGGWGAPVRGSARPRARLARPGLALALLVCLACYEGRQTGEAGPSPDEAATTPAPDLELPDLDGNAVSLAALRGRVVVIDFWATWCAPCVFQIPVLNEFQADHPEVAVLGVSVDFEGRSVVEPFAREHEVGYPVLLGNEAVAREFGAMGFPTLFVIAPDGTIRSVHMGVVDREELESAVAEAGAGTPPGSAES